MPLDINSVSTGHDALPVTPNDAVDLPQTARGLLIAVGGTLKVNTLDGGVANPRALTVPAGVFPCVVTRVWSTGTAATGITALI